MFLTQSLGPVISIKYSLITSSTIRQSDGNILEVVLAYFEFTQVHNTPRFVLIRPMLYVSPNNEQANLF